MKSKTIPGTIVFKEIQQMRQRWLWLLVIGIVLFTIGLTIAFGMSEDRARREAFFSLLIVVPVNALMLYLMYIVRLETYVTSEAVYYRWWPFFKKFSMIPLEDMEVVELRKSPPLQYGYKYLPGFGRVHNLANGKGLRFITKSGKKIFIGSQKINGFQRAVEKLIPVSTR